MAHAFRALHKSGLMRIKQTSTERLDLARASATPACAVRTRRLAVLHQLRQSRTPLSHANIASTLAPLGYDRATVYRNLVDLSEAGLISRVDLGDHVWRFELRSEGKHDADEHPHFVCTECGEVSCLVGVEVSVTPAPGTKRSAVGEVTEVLLKGRCNRCS